MKPKLILCLALALSGGLPGCSTSNRHSATASVLNQGQSAVEIVLAGHHFAPPTTVRGAGDVMWTIAARPRSNSAVEIAQVETHPDGRITVEIYSYQYVASEWARLGPKFIDPGLKQEAMTMLDQIRRIP